ncbi:hypothetical protein FoTM2_017149 [Fusarium oxysporum f. sp. vasinfectum]|nr:hypothetical protein FoTM2_017149 [Fusarium oxysporum f. sp. vasinfectum]
MNGSSRIFAFLFSQTTKFRTWPNDLLLDVEDAVSTQVRVMFRWADRQLHELQRLTGERDVVSKALEDFLKTWMRLMAGSFFGHHRRIGNMFLMLFNGFGSVANLALPKVVLHPFLF